MKFSKNSILVSTIILTLGAAVYWHDYQQLAAARVSQNQLIAKLAEVGSHFDLSQTGEKVRITKRQREKKEENQLESSSGLITLIRKIAATFESNDKIDPNASAELRDFETRLESLDTAQWKALLAKIEADHVFKEYGDSNVILSSMMMEMNAYFRDSDQPQTFLSLAAEFKGLFKDNEKSLEAMRSCIELWTKQDSTAAVAWLRNNHGMFPGLVDGYGIQEKAIPTVAIKDPALAFQLIGELEIEDPINLVSHMGQSAEDSEDRTAILVALRHHVSVMPEGEERDRILNAGVVGLMGSAMMQGFETGTEWIDHAGITPEQFAMVFDHIAKDGRGFDGKGQWIDWLILHLPQKKMTEKVSALVTTWTKENHKSAGDWISHNADGPVKNAAINAYSYEVAAYEPAVAVQWAMSLPAGENREQALEGVYKNWLKTDAHGREAFGKLYGFE